MALGHRSEADELVGASLGHLQIQDFGVLRSLFGVALCLVCFWIVNLEALRHRLDGHGWLCQGPGGN